MSLRFYDKRTLKIQTLVDKLKNGRLRGIPLSSEILGIEVRMLPPLIKNNRTVRLWPFPGYANVYCLTIVFSDVASQLSGNIDLHSFAGIGDYEYLPVNKVLYYWEPDDNSTIPGQVHVMSSVIKSREVLRNTADILAEVKNNKVYQSLWDQLTYGNGSSALLTKLSMDIAGIVGKYLGKVCDKPLGTIVNSFTRLHGDWDSSGITPVCITTRNVDFYYEIIVRDHTRAREGFGDSY